jgi:DNA polymerase-3 subunit epsilon
MSAALSLSTDNHVPWSGMRFVVFDSESNGLDPHKDDLISIGAVAVRDGAIRLDDAYEVVVRYDFNTSAVFWHGITRDEAAQGASEAEAVEGFLNYASGAVLVGHHVGHDKILLDRLAVKHAGKNLGDQLVDTMALTLDLYEAGAFPDRPKPAQFSLDALCAWFEVAPHDRHTAPGDAFITAQILLKLLAAARRVNRMRLADILYVAEGR